MDLVNQSFTSSKETLACHLAIPAGTTDVTTGLVLCHGFPIGPLDARRSAGTFPELIDRIAHSLGYAAMTFTFRGCGTSTGDFSLQGWVDDLRSAIDFLITSTGVSEVVLVGTNTGGSLGICVAADDPRVSAAALLSPRADFDDWADHPRRFAEHAREIGAIRTPGFPVSVDDWSRAFRRFRPAVAARRFAPRPLLVMHGEEDESVPVSDSRQLAQAHGSAEMCLLPGAGHRLRHDPRAVAILMGWLDRVRSEGDQELGISTDPDPAGSFTLNS
jgi:putative redox protein